MRRIHVKPVCDSEEARGAVVDGANAKGTSSDAVFAAMIKPNAMRIETLSGAADSISSDRLQAFQ